MVVPCNDILIDFLQADSAHTAYSVGEIAVNDLPADSHGFKNLGRLIRLKGGNSHFRRDFDNAVKDSFIVIMDGCVVVFVQHTFVDHF